MCDGELHLAFASSAIQPVYTHPILTTPSPLSLEKHIKSPVEDTQLLSTQVSGQCSQYILQLSFCKGILQQNKYLMWVQPMTTIDYIAGP